MRDLTDSVYSFHALVGVTFGDRVLCTHAFDDINFVSEILANTEQRMAAGDPTRVGGEKSIALSFASLTARNWTRKFITCQGNCPTSAGTPLTIRPSASFSVTASDFMRV